MGDSFFFLPTLANFLPPGGSGQGFSPAKAVFRIGYHLLISPDRVRERLLHGIEERDLEGLEIVILRSNDAESPLGHSIYLESLTFDQDVASFAPTAASAG